MTSIGETLRRERVRQGLDLQQLSQTTKIGTRMLQAMEADDFSKLPGGVFTRSFIKQYANALGISPAQIESELRSLNVEGDVAPLPEARHAEGFSGFSESPVESNSLLASVVWVALALMVCGGVYYIMNRGNAPSAPVTETKAPEPKTSEPKSEPGAAGKAPEAPTPLATAEANPAAAASGPLHVVLSASEDAWVSVSADGKSAFVGTLKPNERREIAANEKIKVVAGNAGGLEISLNGKTLDPLGPRGQVRTVELTQAGAQVIQRQPQNPAPLL